jgi:hypothetical protein
MARRRLAAAAALALVCALAAVPGDAGGAHRSPELWATVNVCDTERHPDMMGVRARMNGNGTSQQMWIRFQAHWFDEARERWRPVGRAATSRWIRLGHARVRSRETGYTFAFDAPAPGERFVVRGVVDYQWRAKRRGRWVVVRRARLNTKRRSGNVRGADPPGYSNGICELRTPSFGTPIP